MVQRIVQDVLVSPETSWSGKGAFRTKSGTRKLQSVAFGRDIWGITGIRWNAESFEQKQRVLGKKAGCNLTKKTIVDGSHLLHSASETESSLLFSFS